MISFDEALQIVVDNSAREMPAETVPLVLASGRVLAQPIIASENIPAEDNSAMDGYAVRADDLATASATSLVQLKVVDESSAGSTASAHVGIGEAIRIMTGGLVPEGAD
ncbi:MAG: molybdopterin molybdenumtransferase MoeA, partial [bacterium]|nr:molybdopterin molybdenumtransferase MoeA [Candidatus Kapabacteria bacterium]